MSQIEHILRQVQSGELSPEAAAVTLNTGFVDLGFARVDTDRERRRGFPEVVYSPGKTTEHIIAVLQALQAAHQHGLATRLSPEQAQGVLEAFPDAIYQPVARMLALNAGDPPPLLGHVAVLCAGTSDLPVAEEAAFTAERLGNRVTRIHDAGIAGLHRLTPHLPTLRAVNAVVIVAGMEGALPSVVGSMIHRPIIAVPTSVGYGTSLNGIAALLAMLNACVSGITVVNIDNGFGAGVAASQINHVAIEAAGHGGAS